MEEQQQQPNHFTTSAAVFRDWSLDAGLRPRAALGLPGAVAVGGASTQLIADLSEPLPVPTYGLTVRTYGPAESLGVAATNEFKLVRVRTPRTRYPPSPLDGTGWDWPDGDDHATCLSPGEGGTVVPDAGCTDTDTADAVSCPGLFVTHSLNAPSVVSVHVQLPVAPGFFIVCYRRVAPGIGSTPWLWLIGSTGSRGIFTVPSFLEFDAGASSSLSPTVDSVQLFDTRSFAGAELSSWCGTGGVSCASAKVELRTDWAAIVNASKLCPTTASPQTEAWAQGARFHLVQRQGTITALTVDGMQAPPSTPSDTGRYKICIFKAGESSSAATVTRRGLVYAIWNRASPERGTFGQSGFYKPAEASSIDGLLVTPATEYDPSVHFVTADSQTANTYSQISPAALQAASGGIRSNTPVIDSGGHVDIEVEASAGGSAVPFGEFAVEALMCPETLTWADVQCERPVSVTDSSSPTAPFIARNVLGACNHTTGPQYGWGDNGLRQFLSGGRVTFRVQMRSACPSGSAEVNAGCGIRFSATTDEGTVVYSKPVWVNVRPQSPDAVAVGVDAAGAPQRIESQRPGTAQDPESCAAAGLPQCYVQKCQSHQPCTLQVFALRGGPQLFAPEGTVSVLYSMADYQTIGGALSALQASFESGLLQFVDLDWRAGGQQAASFVPLLRPGVSVGNIFYNVSYGSSWSRFVVEVSRVKPQRLLVRDIVPLDTGPQGLAATASRTPVPTWSMTRTELPSEVPGSRPPASLNADAGSYLEALAPYELRYQVEGDFEGTPVTLSGEDLSGWNLRVTIDGIPDTALNAVLAVELSACAPGETCQPSPDPVSNMLTTPRYTRVQQDTAPSASGNGLWALWFRLRSGYGCGRLSGGTAPGGVGCRLRVGLMSQGLDTELVAYVTTPVRTVGDTVRVLVDQTQGPLRDGVTVTALPGALSGRGFDARFDVDEYHFGNIFALIASPEPLQASGTLNRDGVGLMANHTGASCRAIQHATLGLVWAAQWQLRTTLPCRSCDFTFHSDWGPSPTSVYSSDGTAELTLLDDAVGLSCIGPTRVGYVAGSSSTHTFSATVIAVDGGGAEVGWPEWRVAADTAVQIAPPPTGGSPTPTSDITTAGVLTGVMSAGSVVLPGLRLDRAGNASFPAGVVLRITAVAVRYDDLVSGAAELSTETVSCTATVPLQEGAPPSGGGYVRIAAPLVTDAVPLCESAPNTTAPWCEDWLATTDASSLSFPVRTLLATGEADPAARDFTVRVAGTALTTGAGWNCSAGSCSSESFTLPSDSAFPDLVAGQNSTFRYGSVSLSFRRVSSGTSTVGDGTLHIVFAQPTLPVRSASFELCSTVASQQGEQLDTAVNCTAVRLWVVAPPGVTRTVAVLTHDLQTATMPAGTQQCGGVSAHTIQVIAYYNFPVFSLNQYVEYGRRMTFTLRTAAAGHTLQDAANQTQTGPGLAVGTAPVAVTAPSHFYPSLSPAVDIQFNSVTAIDAAALTVEGGGDDTAGADGVYVTASVGTFGWAHSSPPAVAFSVLDTPLSDDECAPKRRLPQSLHGYRVYRPSPGLGWSYSGGSYAGASVGVPFPIQARVLTQAGDPTTRAWSYPSTVVFAAKGGASLCNDGGELSLYELRPSNDLLSGALNLDGSIATTFDKVSAGRATSLGQATLWPAFSQPCQACTLTVMLCYAAAASSPSADSCLQGATEAEQSNPIFAERTQVTRPFSVTEPVPDSLQVISQSFPSAVDRGGDLTVQVGAPVVVELQPVQHHADWTLRVDAAHAGAVTLAVYSVFLGTSDPELLKYGNGGFLSSAADAQACTVTANEFSAASTDRWRTQVVRAGADLVGGAWRLNFVYTRPCASCMVRLRYQSARMHADFSLREYGGDSPGAAIRFAVRACGVTWIIAGVPLAAVRRRRHFSVAVWRVDANHMPAWGDDAAVQLLQQGPFGGNGGGGVLSVSSPLLQDSPPTLQSAGGVATVRLSYTRACYVCHFTLASKTLDVSVMTDPTRFVAVPHPDTRSFVQYTEAGQVASYVFDVYAADELGDRSYLVGGPTQLTWTPRWLQGTQEGATVSLRGRDPVVINTFDARGQPARILHSGVDQHVRVVNGTKVFNGVPHGLLVRPGAEITGPACLGIQVTSTIAGLGLDLTAGGYSLPTTVLAGRASIAASLSVPSQRFLVDVVATAPLEVSVGAVKVLTVYSVGRLPGQAAEESVHYVSADPVADPAILSIDCDSPDVPLPPCLTCAFSVGSFHGDVSTAQPSQIDSNGTAAGFLKDGSVKFAVRADVGGAAAGHCRVLITVGNSVLPITVLSVSHVTLTQWKWDSVPGEPPLTGGLVEPVVTSPATVGRLHKVRLRLWSADFAEASRLTPTPFPVNSTSAITLTAVPVVSNGGVDGPCWTPEGNAEINALQNELTWLGRMHTEGVCTVEQVLNLPGGLSLLTQRVRFTARNQSGVEVVPVRSLASGKMLNFSGLGARTAEGAEAGETGVAVGIAFKSLWAGGETNTAEHQVTVDVVATRQMPSGNASTVQLSAAMAAGTTTVNFVPELSTRDPVSGLQYPWSFSAVAWYQDPAVVGRTVVGTVSGVGPLYVVTRAGPIRMQLTTPAGNTSVLPSAHRDCTAESPCPEGILAPLTEGAAVEWDMGQTSGPLQDDVPYVSGWPFSLRFMVRDAYGSPPRHPEDPGYAISLLFSPVDVPCINADIEARNGPAAGCYVGGECTLAAVPACSPTDWSIGRSATDQGGFKFDFGPPGNTPGVYEVGGRGGVVDPLSDIPPVRYLGRQESPTRFTLTSSSGMWMGQIAFQRTAGVQLLGDGTGCRAESGAMRCSMPAQFAGSPRRISPLTPFKLGLVVVDSQGKPVVGDSASTMRVTAVCVGQVVDAVFSLGRSTGFSGNQFLEVEVLGTVSSGELLLEGVAFPFSCNQAELRAELLPLSAAIDALDLNSVALPLVTERFEVLPPTPPDGQQTPLPTAAPPAPPYREFPTVTLQLGIVIDDILQFSASKFEEAVAADMNLGTVSRVVLELVCNIPTQRVKRRPPIFEADRNNPSICHRFADAAAPSRRPAPLQEDLHAGTDACPCVPVAEFRVEHSAAKDDPAVQQDIISALEAIPGSNSSATAGQYGVAEGALSVVSAGPVRPPPEPTPAPATPAPDTPQPPDPPVATDPPDPPITPPADDSPDSLSGGGRVRSALAAALALAAAAVVV
eukprot:TRINITY_DN11131_c0_g2_i1.p1 TRINITY_DN11131_c0_g2~~TRINITY_DN11131_c0_g2_i1.p1  ORF type:complete len:3471 (+),score=905.78 TRINITY_DN11131_c0_g2_i1:846-10415(+)